MGYQSYDEETLTEYSSEFFSDIFEHNYRRIFNYILYSTGELEAALDITSETFLKALDALKRSKYKEEGLFTAWLYRIASREIAIYFRRKKRDRKYLYVHNAHPNEIERINQYIDFAEYEDVENELKNREDFLLLAPLFRKLPEKYREVLYLRFFEDRTFKEIGLMLGRPIGTIKAQHNRGVRMLRAWMQTSDGDKHLMQEENSIEHADTSYKEVEESGI